MGKRTFMNGAYSRRGGRRQGGSRGGGIVGSLVPSLPVAGANHRWISTAGIIEDGNGVLTWEDVIGGVVLDRQGAAGATIAANALVKQPVVRFPGLGAATMSSDAIGGSSVFNAGNDFTVIAFASPSVLAGTKSFFSASAGAVATSEFNLRTNAGPNLVCVRNGSTTSISTAKVPTSTFSRMIVRWDDSADSFDFKTNGVDEPRANGGDPVAVQTRYTIGANATLIGNLAAGDLCEVIVYDRRLTDAEATAIDQYLVARYFETLIHELGAQAWWDTTDNSNISIDAGGVDVFTDRIGGVELLQGTPSARPTVEFSERLGHQAFRYDGVQTLENTALGGTAVCDMFEDAKDLTVYVQSAHDTTPPATTDVLFSAALASSPGTDNFRMSFNSNTLLTNGTYIGAGTSKGTSSAAGSTPHLAASWAMAGIDGTDIVASARTSPTPTTNALLGADMLVCDAISIGARIGSQLFEGVIGQVMFFNYALTTAQRTRIEDFLEGLSAGVETPMRVGAFAHFDPTRNDKITIVDDAVSAYEDKIGGFIVSQSTPSQRPTISQSIRTGHQMLSLDRVAAQGLSGATSLAEVFRDAGPATVYTEVVGAGASFRTVCSAFEAADSSNEHFFQQVTNTQVVRTRLKDVANGTSTASTAGTVPPRAARWIRSAVNGTDIESEGIGLDEGTNTLGAIGPAALDTFEIGGLDGGSTWDGAIGHLCIFGHDLNAQDSAAMAGFMESRWLNAEVALRLGCDILLDGEDLTTAAWPDRVGGPDFIPTTAFQLGTFNGRPCAVFDDTYSASRTDPTADTTRFDSTSAFVWEQTDASNDGTLVSHGDGVAVLNQVVFRIRNPANVNKLQLSRADGATTTNYQAGANTGGEGNRTHAVVTYDDSGVPGTARLHMPGDVFNPSVTDRALTVTQPTTTLGARRISDTNLGFIGKIPFYAQFAHVMGDDDRAQLEDYLFDRFYNWAAAEGTAGAIDDIGVRWVGEDIVSGSSWPSREGSLHPLTLEPTNNVPVVTDPNPALGNARTMTFGVNDKLRADVGSFLTDADGFWAVVSKFDSLGSRNRVVEIVDADTGVAHVDQRSLVVETSGVWAYRVAADGLVIFNTTTEAVGEGEAAVAAGADTDRGTASAVLLNGVIQSFSGSPNPAFASGLRYFFVGGRGLSGVEPMVGDIAEAIYGRRRLGTAELIAWAAYVDQRYLDPSLVGG